MEVGDDVGDKFVMVLVMQMTKLRNNEEDIISSSTFMS